LKAFAANSWQEQRDRLWSAQGAAVTLEVRRTVAAALRCARFEKMDERTFYRESQTTKPATLNCPFCRTSDTYELRWLVRKKIDRLPGGADERDRAKFAKAASYMVLLDDKAMCKNMRCRKRFDISGIKTTAFI